MVWKQQRRKTGLSRDANLLDQFGDAPGNVVALRELGVDEQSDFHGMPFDGGRGVVPGAGFEPATFGLQNRCTTTVLTRPVSLSIRGMAATIPSGDRIPARQVNTSCGLLSQ